MPKYMLSQKQAALLAFEIFGKQLETGGKFK